MKKCGKCQEHKPKTQFGKNKARRDGLEFEVDHIIPLQAESASGLHNEFNLQVLTKEENRAKYNKFEVNSDG